MTGLNLGLRYDEVAKLRLQCVSVSSERITLRTGEGVKKQTGRRSYDIEDWPGDTPLRCSLFLDPFVAILSWLTIQGPKDGFLFCDVKNNSGCCKIDFSSRLTSTRLTKLLCSKLLTIVIARADVLMYSGHSLKRVSV